ncbi:MAG: hypothetical protein QOJ26_1343, partial [Thermoplasmata archaeon]|nr:hypothetical protein [Thermoplasmata archaeon]
ADAVQLDLVLRQADVRLDDPGRAVALAQLGGDAQQVEGAARVISKGRYGRTREIQMSCPIDSTRRVLEEDELIRTVVNFKPRKGGGGQHRLV